jgi:uncharacterized protein (DUF433 family)
MNWRDRITSDPLVLRGKPCIKGTRIPAALVLGYLAAGKDAAAILREFPDLTQPDVSACLDYARDLAHDDFPENPPFPCGPTSVISAASCLSLG